MERIRTWKPRRLAITGGLLLVVTLILAFWMREVVNEMIVLPVSYILYVAGIFIDTTPQIFFWLAIILIAFWVAYRSLRHRTKLDAPSAGAWQDQISPPTSGRMRYWAVKVNLLRQYRSSYYQGGFHSALSRLLVEMLAHRYRLTNSQVEQRLRAGEIDLPPEVQEYALFCLRRPESRQSDFFRRIWEDFLDFLHTRFGMKVSHLSLNTLSARAAQRVDSVINYMEEELEVPNEHPSQ